MSNEILPRLIGRGVLSGALAGLVSGGFAFFVAEPVMDRAVELEGRRSEAADKAAGITPEAMEEMFTRSEQHLGLILATVGAGIAFGVLFSVMYWALFHRTAATRPWERSLGLAGAVFTGFWLLPFIRYPANPPGVGDPESLGSREYGWTASIAIGLITVFVAWRLATSLADRPKHVRQPAAVALVVVATALLFLLPDNTDPLPVPAGLLWDFRVLAAASSTILWTFLGAAFGYLGVRDARRSRTAPAATEVGV
ncbi:CbtA family protein [Actinocorallia longicatena]|uniref:CbtA family protein n=1 Tax=Actinocorallia longicatena TaxID=111803 RepID=A0ABP6PZK3_9ACTN